MYIAPTCKISIYNGCMCVGKRDFVCLHQEIEFRFLKCMDFWNWDWNWWLNGSKLAQICLFVLSHCGYGILSDYFFLFTFFWACSVGTSCYVQTFWSKYLWIFLAIYVDYSYFDAQVRCTYLVPNMTLTLMFNRNYNNLRYSIKKIKSLLEQKFFLLKSVCEFSLKHWQ